MLNKYVKLFLLPLSLSLSLSLFLLHIHFKQTYEIVKKTKMLNRFFEHQVLVINVDYIKQSFEFEIIYV